MFLAIISDEIDDVLQIGINILLGISAFVFIFMIITTGIKFMTSNSAEEHQQAKSKLIWVIIGFVLSIMAVVIFNVVWSLVGQGTTLTPTDISR